MLFSYLNLRSTPTQTYSRFPERPFQALRKEHEALVASGINIGGAGISGTASIASTNSSSSTLSLNMLTGGGASTTPTVLSTLHNDTTHDFNGAFSMEESCSLGAAGGDTSDSKDSQLQTQQQQQQQQHQSKDDLPKEWFYDEMDMNDVDSLEDPKSPADDEYDYDPRYGNKKRRKRRPGKRGTTHASSETATTSNSNSARRRTAVTRTRVTTTDAALDASLEAIEAGDIGGTPTSSGGRRSRGAGTRGRRRAKGTPTGNTTTSASGMPSNTCDPPSPGLVNEPPSFESAAAAVGVGGVGVEDGNAHLRNYRKYL